MPCCCFGIGKAPAGTIVTIPAVLMELHPKSPWRIGFPGHANKGFYGLTVSGNNKNLPLCIVDPQDQAEVCHDSQLHLVRIVCRGQTTSWNECVLQHKWWIPRSSESLLLTNRLAVPWYCEQCPERLSKGLGGVRGKK